MLSRLVALESLDMPEAERKVFVGGLQYGDVTSAEVKITRKPVLAL